MIVQQDPDSDSVVGVLLFPGLWSWVFGLRNCSCRLSKAILAILGDWKIVGWRILRGNELIGDGIVPFSGVLAGLGKRHVGRSTVGAGGLVLGGRLGRLEGFSSMKSRFSTLGPSWFGSGFHY
jgi:hypothetical protein